MSSKEIGLDFETYGYVSLPDHGLDRYVSDSSFKVLIAATAWQDDMGRVHTQRYDFVLDPDAVGRLQRDLMSRVIVAHNVAFEKACLDWLGIEVYQEQLIDSAVIARACGAGSSLEAAAPQLLGTDKLDMGKDLIKLFSIPGKYQEAADTRDFCPDIVLANRDEWESFADYCELDAVLSFRIWRDWGKYIPQKEHQFAGITRDMNERGWTVDVPAVKEMKRRYLENIGALEAAFRMDCDAQDLNLNSLKQLKEWCLERGIRATSFDEKNVRKLILKIEERLGQKTVSRVTRDGYYDVLRLLRTKQELGGSSLKKLQVILDTVNNGKLKDQYLHCGAGQTWRTTGRSVQMQNLKRLSIPKDMDSIHDDGVSWSNEELAVNLRQLFTASDPQGSLLVGDFASVESRGLAWFAQATWKIDAFKQGQDMYKVLAGKIYNVPYDDVTKEQRQVGKVGELGCGYGIGGGALMSFAETMGIQMSEAEAAKLVSDWRAVNPEIGDLWHRLETLLRAAMSTVGSQRMELLDGFRLQFYQTPTPSSLLDQHEDAQSITMDVLAPGGGVFMRRIFHGCYFRGRDICYYKPSQRKTGDLWSSHYVDPKTHQVVFFKLYGGKLAGILTQSFCRELFMRSLREVHTWAKKVPNVELIGQFHDEIVVDWKPGQLSREGAMLDLRKMMSSPALAKSFPLDAEIKYDYRYTK